MAFAYTAPTTERKNAMIQKTDYVFKTPPWEHQAEAFALSRDEDFFALFMEQRTGKSKVLIDTAAWRYGKGDIDAVLIGAPNGVHRLWLTDEIPLHMPDHVPVQRFLWTAGCTKTKKGKEKFAKVIRTRRLLVFAFNIDSLRTDAGKQAIRTLLDSRKCMFIIDESTDIKSPSSARTRTLIGYRGALGFAEMAPVRRIATGTPSPQGPFDLYSQFKFLDKDFWADLGSFRGFKHYFGVFDKGYNGRTGREYDELVEYKNIEELNQRISKFSYRVLRKDCFDLPPQVFAKKPFDLSVEQRRMYETLKEEFILELDGGEEITADMAIVRLTRLQQIASNFLPSETGELVRLSEKDNRLEALAELLEQERTVQSIIWYRFQENGRQITELAERMGMSCVRYDGTVKEVQREKNKKRFMAGEAQLFIGNPSVGGRGLDLWMAHNSVYYTNSFNLEHRLQSQDRTENKKRAHSVGVHDLIALDTVDERIVQALRAKQDIASMIVGDQLREWL